MSNVTIREQFEDGVSLNLTTRATNALFTLLGAAIDQTEDETLYNFYELLLYLDAEEDVFSATIVEHEDEGLSGVVIQERI